MHYDHCTAPYKKLADAWNLFTDTGTFNKGVPRIDEYTSWVRCRHENICGPVVPLDENQLAQKQIINEQLISNARPIIDSVDNILQRSLRSNYAIFLMDSDGLIIDIDYRGNDEIPVGNRCNELYACNNAVEISSQEKKIVEVYGYEHLYPEAGDWHTIGDLVFNYDKSIAGGLGIVSEVNSVSSIVPILRIGSQMIRSNLVFEQIANDKITMLLEEIPEAVIAINGTGTIMNANQATASFMGLSREQMRGHKVNEYLVGEVDYQTLYSFSQGFNVFNNVSVRAKGRVHHMVMKKSIIGNYNGNSLILVTFKPKSFKNLGARIVADIPQPMQFHDLIGESSPIKSIKIIAAKAARTSTSVLIQGESGTGKELVAQAIHQSSRPQGTFVAINCGAFTKELLQSELFGYEEGAFTGAKKGGKPGKFELADGGTLFLDEIGEMPLDMQVSLLRCLQDKTVTRVGGVEAKKIDLRIIAATNQNLFKQVKEGKFREDLYYRLNVIELTMPPLRERLADLQLLSEFLVKQLESELGVADEIKISPEVIDCMSQYNWPGNVRELRNVLERAIIYADDAEITLDCMPEHIREGKPRSDGNDILKEYEKMAIIEVLTRNKGNISKTAEELGMARSTLYQKMEKLNIEH